MAVQDSKLNNGPTSDPTGRNVGANADQQPRKMPIGLVTEPQCKTCNSPHRAEIEERLFGGQSFRSVSAWLQNAHEEHIGPDLLCRHRQKHCNAALEARERIARQQLHASQPAFEAAVGMVVADAATLDRVAEIALDVLGSAAEAIKKGARGVHDVNLFTAASHQARGAVMDKHQLLGGDKPGGGGNDGTTTLAQLDALRAAAAANEAA